MPIAPGDVAMAKKRRFLTPLGGRQEEADHAPEGTAGIRLKLVAGGPDAADLAALRTRSRERNAGLRIEGT